MKKQHCRECGEHTRHKPYRSNLFKYEGERVKTCRKCGNLRTNSRERFPEAEMVHIPSQTKKKDMEENDR